MAMRIARLLSASLSSHLPHLVEFVAARYRMPPPICHGAARKFSSAASPTLLEEESVGAADSDASSSAAFPTLLDSVAGRIDRPPTCHGAAVEVNNLSSAAPPARPERLAVPLHLLSAQHSSRRSFSSQSDANIQIPHASSNILLPHERKVIVPSFHQGVIRPDLGYFRAKGVDGPRLPIVRQLSFYEEEDVYLTPWETPLVYLNNVFSLRPAYLNPLLADVDPQLMMHTKFMRTLWKSAMDLVTVNRFRGYCISKALVEQNLAVSRIHGTFALIRPIADDISVDPSSFMGFKAVKRLFYSLMEQRYGSDFHSMLMLDIQDWLATLDDPIQSDGKLPTDHAWMLPDEDRVWMSIRLAQLLSGELNLHVGKVLGREVSPALLASFHHLSVGIDDLHPFFKAWHDHVRKVKKNMGVAEGGKSDLAEESEESDLAEESEKSDLVDGDKSEKSNLVKGGSWVVRMNRHGPLHWHTRDLSKLAGRKYYLNDVIGLLHHKLPMYLPLAQRKFLQRSIWHLLEMSRCFPKTLVHPRSTSKSK